tara:strand:- start:253 stop:813 length:561 start_codon:yes stop_codon:yes gene_type:complete
MRTNVKVSQSSAVLNKLLLFVLFFGIQNSYSRAFLVINNENSVYIQNLSLLVADDTMLSLLTSSCSFSKGYKGSSVVKYNLGATKPRLTVSFDSLCLNLINTMSEKEAGVQFAFSRCLLSVNNLSLLKTDMTYLQVLFSKIKFSSGHNNSEFTEGCLCQMVSLGTGISDKDSTKYLFSHAITQFGD